MNEFYETIQVPKFHDFTAIEEEAIIDPKAWFNGTNPGTSLNLGLTTHLHICPLVHIFSSRWNLLPRKPNVVQCVFVQV